MSVQFKTHVIRCWHSSAAATAEAAAGAGMRCLCNASQLKACVRDERTKMISTAFVLWVHTSC